MTTEKKSTPDVSNVKFPKSPTITWMSVGELSRGYGVKYACSVETMKASVRSSLFSEVCLAGGVVADCLAKEKNIKKQGRLTALMGAVLCLVCFSLWGAEGGWWFGFDWGLALRGAVGVGLGGVLLVRWSKNEEVRFPFVFPASKIRDSDGTGDGFHLLWGRGDEVFLVRERDGYCLIIDRFRGRNRVRGRAVRLANIGNI